MKRFAVLTVLMAISSLSLAEDQILSWCQGNQIWYHDGAGKPRMLMNCAEYPAVPVCREDVTERDLPDKKIFYHRAYCSR